MEVGIDFGTTFSTLCYNVGEDADDCCVRVAGSIYVPTEILVYPDNSYTIGYRARAAALNNEGLLYVNPKRWIGMNSRNKHIFMDKLKPQHEVLVLNDKDVKIGPLGDVRGKAMFITDLIALFLKGLITEAETQTGVAVVGVTCSVPAKYNSFKRSFLMTALKGLGKPLRALVNEPTAAGLLGMSVSSNDNTVYGVFDFGGGTFDISMMLKRGKVLGVIGAEGDNYLGGRDVDAKIMKTISASLRSAPKKSSFPIIVSKMKEIVSDTLATTEQIIPLEDGSRQIASYTLDQLISDSGPFLDRAVQLFSRLVRDLANPPTEVVLTGGSAALPGLVARCMSVKGVTSVLYNKRTFRASVAMGAKIYADMLTSGSDLVLIDSLSQTLSDDLALFRSAIVFPKGTAIPRTFETSYTVGKSEVPYGLYEGEENSTWLNDLTFKGVAPGSASGSQKAKYSVSLDGRLKIEVDGKEIENTLVPSPVSDAVKDMRYITADMKYKDSLCKLYLSGINSLAPEPCTLKELLDDVGWPKTNRLLQSYKLRSNLIKGWSLRNS
nr:HSP70-like protein [Grapevine leafroll-associated virus 13]